ncbi:MAG: electron transfer flavoprotein subunit beta [Deltaproteobacteria bacterium HGW-Deltaproteobacteria-1]|nr:MAG: electron transfer flavoprotein subunit beta [Deltaproteobacteria bacterium HGW-Deltaproteobacteria-1]
MNIIVCIKQVPDTTDVKINPDTNTLVREGIHNIINPFDLYAIEESLRLKEKFGGKVSVISLGPPQSINALKEAVGMGADEAIQLSDRVFAGSDSWATAYTLALAIKKIGEFEIILCGKHPGLASQLGITQLTYVFKIIRLDPEAGAITVERLLEEGREIVEARLPVLLTVVKDINQPRQATLSHIRRASRLLIPTWTAADLPGADSSRLGLTGSPTQVIKIFSPPRREGVLDLITADNIEQSAIILTDKIIAEKIL